MADNSFSVCVSGNDETEETSLRCGGLGDCEQVSFFSLGWFCLFLLESSC